MSRCAIFLVVLAGVLLGTIPDGANLERAYGACMGAAFALLMQRFLGEKP